MILFDKEINISSVTTGLEIAGSGLITLTNGTISNSTTAIKIAGGSVISAGTINLIDNETGVLIEGEGSKIGYNELNIEGEEGSEYGIYVGKDSSN